MRLFVTGACGFIGSHFVDAAERAGHTVESVDCLTYAGRSKNLGGRPYMHADICDQVLIDALVERMQPDAIVHLAAESHVGRSINSRDEFLRTNVGGTGILLEVALAYWRTHPKFTFLHVSTDEVYGSLGKDDAPWTEACPYAPNNPYAASKAASDFLVRSYHKTFGLPTIITHSSNNYGARQHCEKLIPNLIRQSLAGEALTLHGDGQNVRDWIHVDDHCAGLARRARPRARGRDVQLRRRVRAHEPAGRRARHRNGPPRPSAPHLPDRRPPGQRQALCERCHESARARMEAGPPIEDRIEATVQWYVSKPHYDIDYGRLKLPVPPPGMTMIENVSLEKFEQAVYRRDYEEASGLLLVNLRKFKTGARFIGYGDSPELLKLLYTRFCAAVISLLADPKFEVSQHGFDLLAASTPSSTCCFAPRRSKPRTTCWHSARSSRTFPSSTFASKAARRWRSSC
jgi:dTDP-glucose 4,6-dehydratase